MLTNENENMPNNQKLWALAYSRKVKKEELEGEKKCEPNKESVYMITLVGNF